jgi:L-methionine (R)-S-oxide reductase
MPVRDYDACVTEIRRLLEPEDGREERIRAVTDVLWERLKGEGVAWLGFYTINGAKNALALSSCRPKPACSPIGLHGVCGKAWRTGRSQVVPDVYALGEEHIVCDPANRSEVVVPCFEKAGACWGVLDLDSAGLAGFTEDDVQGLRRVLLAAGLTFS